MADQAVEIDTCPEGICDGSGYIPELEYICDDSTGYNTLVEETGRMRRCACNPPDYEQE